MIKLLNRVLLKVLLQIVASLAIVILFDSERIVIYYLLGILSFHMFMDEVTRVYVQALLNEVKKNET